MAEHHKDPTSTKASSITNIQEMLNEANQLRTKYEQHFKTKMPSRIIGWWDPVNIVNNPDELSRGLRNMEQDINKAIMTNTPFKEIPEKIWNDIVF